ncbi:uncharacterized protein LOC110445613 [Mizuhopecten yessoensis]|uniref:uncharacterized protein LOC110445613 n=1 Tax=Mizuhopecten yessoensis TaxID=6573 RepID=UPI000B457526|nr:uncharacterized protein LOC110445613 [Mizuhopecten yessoensis]XP_021345978.1 uncharacterized protein LOC110445613 [Mizuhopecten yessoensis]
MESQDSIGELLTHAIDFANVMSNSVDSIYRPIAEEAVAYGKRLNVDVVKCGSHAERLYLPYFSRANDDAIWAIDASTDIDMMFVFENYHVVSDVEKSHMKTDIIQYQLVEAAHPGYFFIIPSKDLSSEDVTKLTVSQVQNIALSSETLKRQLEESIKHSRKGAINLIFMETPTLNGPSVTFESRMNSGVMVSIDCVFGVKCSSWPKQLDNFFTRERHCEWPCVTLLGEIREQGCHLVATGAHGSCLRPFEWRLSSTRAEKMLAWSLSEKQRLAYQIAKSLIKSHDKTKCIASYYVKTALFWLCEERQQSVWTASSNLENIKCILEKIFHFFANKNVPNYFVEENNLVDHFEDEIFVHAIEGLVELNEMLLPRLAQLLQRVSVMPVEFQQTPAEMITSENSKALLEYLCVNFCFGSIAHTILSQIENKTHVNYLYLAETMFKHLTSSSHVEQIDTTVKHATNERLSCQEVNKDQTQDVLLNKMWSLSRSGLHSACSLLENIIQYFQSKESDMEIIWKLCVELENIAATLLNGYCQPQNAGTTVVNDCIYLLDRSAHLHHEYAFTYTQKYWKQYPRYRIEPTNNPNKLSFYFLEMWIILLIKYQREGNCQFGIIGRGNKDNMRLPICVRRLVDFMLFYDNDKTWVLLQIDSALFGGKPIANSLKIKCIQHSSTNLKMDGLINLTKLKIRAKAYRTDVEKGHLQVELGKLCCIKGKQCNYSEDQSKWHSRSQEYFRDALSSCPSDISVKVDFAAFLFTTNRNNESIGLLQDVFTCAGEGTTVNTYNINTYRTLPEGLQELVGNKFPIVIPSLLIGCYYILATYKTIKMSRDHSLFGKIVACLKDAVSSSDEDTRKLGQHIITAFLSH